MQEYMSKGIIIGKQEEYEFENKKFYKLPLLLGKFDEQGNFTDKAMVASAKGDKPILRQEEIIFGTQIICTVNEKTYNDKTTLVCSDVEIIKKKN